MACELHSGVEMWLEFKREGATRGSHRIYKQRICEKVCWLQRKKLKETYDMNMNLLSPQDHKFPSLVAKVALKSKRKLIDNL